MTRSLLLLLATAAAVAASYSQYHQTANLLIGGEGGWDYFEVDSDSGRVFIPRDSHIQVLDGQLKLIADISGVDGAHAIVFAPDLKKAFLSTDASVSVLDIASMKITAKTALAGKDPDAILYDKFSHRVFTFNGGGTEDATAVDALTGKIVGNINLGGKPETAQTDGEGHIFVNIEDKSKIADFDASTLKLLHEWPLAPCQTPAGLAIDTAHKRLFVGCRNQLMAMVDYTNGKVVATLPIGKGDDANRFDPATGLAFASCGDGTITVAHEDSPDHLTVVQTIQTKPGARTMALDSRTHKVYTVTAKFGPPPAPTKENPHPYPSLVPNTFAALAFAQ